MHGCPRGVPLYLPPFFTSFRLTFSPVPSSFAFLFYCPLSLCRTLLLPLSLFLSLLLCALLLRPSLSLRNPLSPPGVLPSLDSPYEIGHRTTLDEFPTSPRRVPVPPARDRRLTRPRESFSGRVIKAPLREGMGKHEARVRVFVLLSRYFRFFQPLSSSYPRHFRFFTVP